MNFIKKIVIILFLFIFQGATNVFAMYSDNTELSTVFSQHHVGTEPIETPRLLLRRFVISDAPYIFKNWASDPENVLHLTWKAHSNIETTEKILADWINEYTKNTTYRWCITLKDSDEPIGGIDVTDIIDDKTCEIGYVLSKDCWNKGIMTEATKAVIEYLFDKVGFETITAYHHVDNPASGKVLTKSGMKYIGILKNGAQKNTGKSIDILIYAITRI